MWRMADVDPGAAYQVALLQFANGARNYALVADGETVMPAGTVLLTETVPHALLSAGDLAGIAAAVPLVGGGRFFVDAHGAWLTEDEQHQRERGVGDASIPWLNGMPPN